MKKGYALKVAILVLMAIFISVSAQAYNNNADSNYTLSLATSLILNEESQNLTDIPQTGIKGIVTNPKGEAIQDVKVTGVFLNVTRITYTNQYGIYSLVLPNEDGTIKMKFEKKGYHTYETTDEIFSYNWTWLDVTLDYCPVPKTGIRGCVKNEFTGEPIPGVIVYIWFNNELYIAYTNWAGCFDVELPNIGFPSFAFLEFRKVGFWTKNIYVVIYPNRITTIEVTLTPYPRP